MKLLFLTLLFLAVCARADDHPELSADRNRIGIGDSATLTWKSPGPSAFLMGVGKVAPVGSLQVFPSHSIDYVLVSEKGGKVEIAKFTVAVDGERGDSSFPDVDDFSPGIAANEEHLGYTDFLDSALKLLQNKMKFSVRGEFLPGRPFDVLYTNREVKDDLIRSTDQGVRHRRIAYAVRVEQPAMGAPSKVHFEVETLVDYQLQGESKWRQDSDPQIGHDAADAVIHQLVPAQ